MKKNRFFVSWVEHSSGWPFNWPEAGYGALVVEETWDVGAGRVKKSKSKEMSDTDIRKLVEERVRAAERFPAKKPKEKPIYTAQDLRWCLSANELGDGVLYAMIHRGRFIYVKNAQDWLWWSGHHWKRDPRGLRALAAVESGPVNAYNCEYDRLSQASTAAVKAGQTTVVEKLQAKQKMLHRRIERLRTNRGRDNCVKMAVSNEVSPLAIDGTEIDISPFKIATPSGVINLQTGLLVPGSPKEYLLKHSKVEWRGIDCPAPVWENFLLEIFKNDLELVDFLARLFGYFLTGVTIEHVVAVLYGRYRNGKGTLMEAIADVMGDMATPIPSEMLLDQGRVRNSAGPSPDIMSLKGLRLAYASESDDGRRFSHARIKWLTGGDTLTGRRPHEKDPEKFAASHHLILLTNDMPEKNHTDQAFWERLILIPFHLHFVNREPQTDNERRADIHLLSKLRDEASGILAWLVRGCLAWQKKGLDPPMAVREAVSKYRADGDFIQEWINERVAIDPGAVSKCGDLFGDFEIWFTSAYGSDEPPFKVRTFSKLMKRRFEHRTSGTSNFYGLKLRGL